MLASIGLAPMKSAQTDAPTGTLTSAPFTVSHPYASFLIGGGHHEDTSVELLDPLGRVFYRASGKDDETMHVRWVDLSGRVGQPHADSIAGQADRALGTRQLR